MSPYKKRCRGSTDVTCCFQICLQDLGSGQATTTTPPCSPHSEIGTTVALQTDRAQYGSLLCFNETVSEVFVRRNDCNYYYPGSASHGLFPRKFAIASSVFAFSRAFSSGESESLHISRTRTPSSMGLEHRAPMGSYSKGMDLGRLASADIVVRSRPPRPSF